MKRQRTVDIILLVCVVVLVVATWAAISRADGVGAWKHCLFVSGTMFLALAAVTPHPTWAFSVRLALSGWLVTALCFLQFGELTGAKWVYLLAGSLIAALSAPDLLFRPALRSPQDAG